MAEFSRTREEAITDLVTLQEVTCSGVLKKGLMIPVAIKKKRELMNGRITFVSTSCYRKISSFAVSNDTAETNPSITLFTET